GKIPVLFGHMALSSNERLTSAHDPVPRLMVFRMSNPNTEIRIRPGSWRQPIQFFRRHLFQSLRQCHRLQSGIFLDTFEDPPQKIAATVRVVVPWVFAIKCDDNMGTIG